MSRRRIRRAARIAFAILEIAALAALPWILATACLALKIAIEN